MKRLHELSIKSSENSTTIKLDDFEIKNVTEYELKSSANEPTELLIKIIVSISEIGQK